ncbi:MAG: NAD(P)H-hydrate dehydratase [Candidatus Poseidoniia archaeon]|nr:NAD(P)H-hydrate dehydratase [Candidatus Poseidoniia archaeon]
MRDIEEFGILDINAVAKGYDLFSLMEKAGECLAKHIQSKFPKEFLILFLCGKGNNAGDGYVAASLLDREGFNVKLIAIEELSKSVAKKASELFTGSAVDVSYLDEVSQENTLIVDCLLGSGIVGEPRLAYFKTIKKINTFRNILSVDIPSGFKSGTAVIPSQTITFHDSKTGMDVDNCGEIFILDIGITDEIDEFCGPGELRLFPQFEPNNHKGQNGKVAIIGGAEFGGAVSLAGMGAYRSGADLVHIFVPDDNYNQVSTFAPELIVHNIGKRDMLNSIYNVCDTENFNSFVIGPGMGKGLKFKHIINGIISRFDNLVIDADAIQVYDFNGKNVILTPHGGELARLNIQRTKEQLMRFSSKHAITLLSKGKTDYVTDGSHFKVNITGHPRMAVGGTGDLLAGLCGGLMARGLTPFQAGRLACYAIGLAGEKCYKEMGPGFLPSELSLFISRVLNQV